MEPANKKARVTTLSPAVKAVAAADEATEKFAEVMNRALADATKAEAERDVLAARVAKAEKERDVLAARVFALEAHVRALRYLRGTEAAGDVSPVLTYLDDAYNPFVI